MHSNLKGFQKINVFGLNFQIKSHNVRSGRVKMLNNEQNITSNSRKAVQIRLAAWFSACEFM